jgi:hypothetical protein
MDPAEGFIDGGDLFPRKFAGYAPDPAFVD